MFFVCLVWFNPYSNTLWVLFLFPLCRWGTWTLEVTQLVSGKALALILGCLKAETRALNHHAGFNDPLNDVNSENDNLNKLILSFLLPFLCLSFLDCSYHFSIHVPRFYRHGCYLPFPLPCLLSFHFKWWHVVKVLKHMGWVVRYMGLHPSGVMILHIFLSSLSCVVSESS